MQILITASTDAEIQRLQDLPSSVDVEITGVGCPSTLYRLQKRLQQKKYDFVLQAGIAGTFNDTLQSGQVVIVQQDTFADIGMEECGQFTSIYQTAFADKNKFPFTNGWLINEYAYLNTFKLPLVKGVTINKVSDSAIQKEQLIKNFSADIETMEGAALHYVCLQEAIPFLQVRSISNEVGVRDKSKWAMREAIANLNEKGKEIINSISKIAAYN